MHIIGKLITFSFIIYIQRSITIKKRCPIAIGISYNLPFLLRYFLWSWGGGIKQNRFLFLTIKFSSYVHKHISCQGISINIKVSLHMQRQLVFNICFEATKIKKCKPLNNLCYSFLLIWPPWVNKNVMNITKLL